ncbi:recombinase family protein [Salinicoccus roseus]|uniref:recombinase family protein n=1 Tax=Salinicoccus roseus TaxID=45670 RepID=UPI0022FFF92C|nr:recombinase family protein [Salinicoccus roseus]
MNPYKQNERIKVALYARVSTAMQASDGFSIDAQIETLTQHCKKLGYDIYNIYIDKGLSGSDMSKRSSLLNMLEDAKQQKFDKVYVWKLSRLARNVRDLISMVEVLQDHSVDFHSYSESFEVTTSTGMFMMQMLAAVSEYERNIIIDNVKLGQAQRAMNGYTNGKLPLGYNKPDSPRIPIEINPYEAEIIKQIFNMYEAGHGLRSIANSLNQKGYRTKKGNAFSITAIKTVLTNPIYSGMVRFNQYLDYAKHGRKFKNENPILVEGKHEAIISKEQWENVQDKLQQRFFMPKVMGDGSNLLTGILRCPQCSSAMMAANTTNTLKDGTKKRIRYYSCQQFRAKGSTVCSANSVRADDIEGMIQSNIIQLINQPTILNMVVEENNQRIQKEQMALKRQHPQLEADIIELGEKITRLKNAAAADEDVHTMLQPEIESLRTELESNKMLIQSHHAKVEGTIEDSKTYSEEELKQILEKLSRSFSAKNKMQIKKMYLTIIDKVTFSKKKGNRKIEDITIHLKKEIGTVLLENMNTSGASEKEAPLSLFSEGIIIKCNAQ